MRLRVLEDEFGILKLKLPQSFPTWLGEAEVFFVARTEDEYSIMCPQQHIPHEIPYSDGYRCLRVDGELAFDEIGVVAGVSKPLAAAGLSLFLVSTHDRDYVFVHQRDLTIAIEVYEREGFSVVTSD